MTYLDPGSGSFILQLLIAAILGGLVAIRAYWGRIKTYVKRLLSREDVDSELES